MAFREHGTRARRRGPATTPPSTAADGSPGSVDTGGMTAARRTDPPMRPPSDTDRQAMLDIAVRDGDRARHLADGDQR